MGMAISVPRYTVADLDAFPEDGNRYELLDGVLLVTHAPRNAHQIAAHRLQVRLSAAVEATGDAYIVGPGVIRIQPSTRLEPDILVYPSCFLPGIAWEEITRHWLAVEVMSRSLYMYDREFKRDAYFAIGVAEVWLVDIAAKSVEVWRRGGSEIVRGTLRWHVPEIDRIVAIDLGDVFAGLA